MSTESRLFPFGNEIGDVELPMSTPDGNSPYITPPLGFPFMGKQYDRLFVSMQVFKVILKSKFSHLSTALMDFKIDTSQHTVAFTAGLLFLF